MALGDSASLLFKIKGDATDAIRALKDTEKASDDLTGTTTSLSSVLSGPLAAAGALAAAGIVAVGTAAIATSRAVYEMSKSAADFGSEIYDASSKTGLAAQTLSALKFAADQSGSSFEQVTKGVTFFQVELGKATLEGGKAADKMKALGVTSTDTRTALAQVVKTIYEAQDANQQAALAAEAFGKKMGPDLIPLIKDAHGNLDELEKKAKDLGVTITDEAMVAADEFGDQLDLLNKQFDGIARTIGFAFIPTFNDMARSMSDWLVANGDAIKSWAQNVADTVNGVIITIRALNTATQEATNSSIVQWANWAIRMQAAIDPVAAAFVFLINKMREVGSASRGVQGFAQGVVSPALGMVTPRTGGGGARGGGGRSQEDRERDKAEREAEQAARRDLAAQITIEANNLKTVQDSFNGALDNLRKSLNAGSDLKAFQSAIADATKQGVDNLVASLSHLEDLEREQLRADASENERAVLRQEQEERRHKLRVGYEQDIKKLQDDAWEEQLKRGEVQAEMDQRHFEAQLEQAQQLEEALSGIPGISSKDPILAPEEEDGGIFGAWTRSWEDFVHAISEDAPTLSDMLGGVAEMLQNTFEGVANAVGQVIQNWVLMGNTGPAVMKKILAAALASLAAEAAVRAIFELAMGFAALFFNPAEAAAHFTAAALFGSIAVVSGLAGRAIAGDSFRQQTNGAGATSARGASGGQSSGEGQGSAYSSYGDKVAVSEQGRNAPMGMTVKISDDSTWLGKMLKFELENNSGVRGMIKEVAAT